MIFKNFNLIFLDKVELGSIKVEKGKITEINPAQYKDHNVIDGEGKYLSPGFIDIHIHGAGNKDTMDGNFNSLNTISKTIANYGTTTFLPTTMTQSIESINKAVAACKDAKGKVEGAHIGGVHLEGPFISPYALGAQNPNFLLKPSIKNFEKTVGENISLIKNVTIAPELEGVKELVPYLRKHNINVSMGHTKARYKEAMEGIKLGFNHSTHLFNAMTPFSHREPGVVGAIFDSDITTETISDGIHISYPALRIACKQKSSDKMVLVSDAMMACGMPEGDYRLGGQKVVYKNDQVRLATGALAGSILTIDKAVRNVFKNTDLALHEVIKMATYNGAKFLGLEKKKGKIEAFYDADLIILNKDLNVEGVYIKGKKFK